MGIFEHMTKVLLKEILIWIYLCILGVLTMVFSELLQMNDYTLLVLYFMMTSTNGNIFHITSRLCGEFTGHRRIPLTKASEAELWCFLWSATELTVE